MAETTNNQLTYQQFQDATLKDLENDPRLLQSYGKAWGADPSRLLSQWQSGYRSFDADKGYLLSDRGINSQFREGTELSYNLQRYGNWNNPQNPADQRQAFAEREKGLVNLEGAKKAYIDLGIDPSTVPQFAQYLSQFGVTPGTGLTAQQTATMPAFGGRPQEPSLGRKLGPTEFANLRKELGVSESNFGDYFNRDSQGNIYLKDKGAKDERKQGESVADFTGRLDESQAAAQPDVAKPAAGPAQTSESVRADIAKRIRKELMPSGEAPAAPNSAEERIRLRREQGVMSDEQDLNDLRNDYRMGQEELRVFKSRAGQGVSEGGRIGAVSEAERNLNFRLEGLALREQALVERVNSKNAYIDQVISDRQGDYANALNKWNSEFAVNSKVSELVNAQLDDVQKDAIATVTTITNLMKDSGTPYDQWSPEMKSQVETAALRAGLPKDIFKTVYSSLGKDEKVLETKFVTNATGGTDVYNVVQDANGTVSVVKATGSIPGFGGGDEETRKYVADLAKSYPDAGIKLGDTVADAQAKLEKSAIYQKAVGGTEKTPTVEQSKAQQFAVTAENADKAIIASGYSPGMIEIGFLPNLLKSKERQLFEQGARAFVNSVLRRESGATITDAEYNNKFRELIPMAGDSKEVVAQKATARQAVIKSIQEAGNGGEGTRTEPSQDEIYTNPTTGEQFEKGADGLYYPKADGGAGAAEIKPLSIGGRTVKVSSAISDRLAAADADFFAATGKHLEVNQSYRTREEQARLYAELSKKGARVAPPGKSFHEKGLAVDVTNWKEAEPFLRKYGLRNDLADDRGHFSWGEFS